MEPSLEFARVAEHHGMSHAVEAGFAAVSVAVALLGIYLAYRLYVARPGSADGLARRFGWLYTLLFRKYYVDEIYDAALVKPVVAGSREVLWKGIDVQVVDGLVNGMGLSVQAWLRT